MNVFRILYCLLHLLLAVVYIQSMHHEFSVLEYGLMGAIQRGNKLEVLFWLKQGASPKLYNNAYNSLDYARRSQQIEVFHQLLQHDETLLHDKNLFSTTALIRSLEESTQPEFTFALLDHGADVQVTTLDNQTMFHLAAFKANKKLVLGLFLHTSCIRKIKKTNTLQQHCLNHIVSTITPQTFPDTIALLPKTLMSSILSKLITIKSFCQMQSFIAELPTDRRDETAIMCAQLYTKKRIKIIRELLGKRDRCGHTAAESAQLSRHYELVPLLKPETFVQHLPRETSTIIQHRLLTFAKKDLS